MTEDPRADCVSGRCPRRFFVFLHADPLGSHDQGSQFALAALTHLEEVVIDREAYLRFWQPLGVPEFRQGLDQARINRVSIHRVDEFQRWLTEHVGQEPIVYLTYFGHAGTGSEVRPPPPDESVPAHSRRPLATEENYLWGGLYFGHDDAPGTNLSNRNLGNDVPTSFLREYTWSEHAQTQIRIFGCRGAHRPEVPRVLRTDRECTTRDRWIVLNDHEGQYQDESRCIAQQLADTLGIMTYGFTDNGWFTTNPDVGHFRIPYRQSGGHRQQTYHHWLVSKNLGRQHAIAGRYPGLQSTPGRRRMYNFVSCRAHSSYPMPDHINNASPAASPSGGRIDLGALRFHRESSTTDLSNEYCR